MKIHPRRAAQLTLALSLALFAQGAEAQSAAVPSNSRLRQLNSASGQIPLEFEANRGQAPAPYAFVAHGPSYSLALSSTQVTLSLHSLAQNAKSGQVAALPVPIQAGRIALQLIGANEKSTLSGLDPRPGRSNYFLGSDPSKWVTQVPHFGRVQIAQPYPGIDLVFYGNPQQLEYDFLVAPGADPSQIRLNPQGATAVSINTEGNALLQTVAGPVELKQPVSYQQIDGIRTPVASAFHLTAANTLTLDFGTYDHGYPLIVDPVLLYAVALGGSNGNQALGMDLDAAGNAYITGNSCSSDFPTTAGVFDTYQGNPNQTSCQDAFVLKLDPTASTLLYSNFFGGSGISSGGHVAVDTSGNAYVAGTTSSANFPLVANIGPPAPQHCPLVPAGFNCPDGFIVKFNPSGSEILFSSLLGGNDYNGAYQVKLNPVSGDLVILGQTNAAIFKPAPNTLETKFDAWTCANSTPCFNSFLLGLDPTTGAFRYGTYLGAWYFCAGGLAFDAEGNIYVAGTAEPPLAASLGKPTFTYAPRGAAATGSDIYILKLHEAENKLTVAYSTLIQGENQDGGAGIAVDKSGNAFIVGSTASLHLPTTAGVLQPLNKWKGSSSCGWPYGVSQLVPNVCGTAFVAKLAPTGALSFLTYLGGSSQTWGEAIGVDSLGNIWLTGVTSSTDFPFSKDAYHPQGVDSAFYEFTPFLAEMSNNGASLPFASPIASILGQSYDLRIDKENNVYVAGFANQVLTTPGVYPGAPASYSPTFVQKWSAGAQPAVQLSATSLTFPSTRIGGISPAQTLTLKNTGAGPLQLGIQLTAPTPEAGFAYSSTNFVQTDNCGQSLAPGASCAFTIRFQPVASASPCPTSNSCYPATAAAKLVIASNASSGEQTVTLTGTLGQGPILVASPSSLNFGAQTAGAVGPAQPLFLDNIGDLFLVPSKIYVTGPNAAEFVAPSGVGPIASQCGATIPVLGSCYLQISFAPAANARGVRAAALVVEDNSPGSPHQIQLTGSVATATPALLVSPTSVTLGPSAIGATINPNNCTGCAFISLTNPSTATVQLTALTFAGPNKGDFNVNAYPPLPISVSPGGNRSFELYFSPKTGAHGLRPGTLTLTTEPKITDLLVIQLIGEAVTNSDPSMYVWSPQPLNFGAEPIGQSSAGEGDAADANNFVEIENQVPYPCANNAKQCGAPLTVTAIAFGLPDYAQTPFGQSLCATPVTIPAGGACLFSVSFAPVKAGSRNTALYVKSNAALSTAALPLTGSGVALPIGILSATALNFGPSAIKVGSQPLSTTLTNTGGAPLIVSSVTVSPDFAIVSNACKAPLAPKSSCTIGVAITPPDPGPFSGTLTITDNDARNGTQLVSLSGSGATGALLRIFPAALNFGVQKLNTTSKPQTLTLTNVGNAPIAFPENAFRTGENFIVESATCKTTLAEQASCAVSIVFKPTQTTFGQVDFSGIFNVTDSAFASPQTVTLTGTSQ